MFLAEPDPLGAKKFGAAAWPVLMTQLPEANTIAAIDRFVVFGWLGTPADRRAVQEKRRIVMETTFGKHGKGKSGKGKEADGQVAAASEVGKGGSAGIGGAPAAAPDPKAKGGKGKGAKVAAPVAGDS